MKRNSKWIALTALLTALSLMLAACGGEKDAASVVTDLEKLSGKLTSYHAEGTMVLNTGQEPQSYGVVVSYQQPSYYRIALTNEAQSITQIVLKNDDGVFVLTPHLNKSFRFQSDWPKNQGQAYLFETIAQAIISDDERQFATEENAFVFDVMANYQNSSLVRQKIWLNKDNYAPQKVVLTDGDANEMVTITFKAFEFDRQFDANWFDMQRNMTSASIQSIPVMGGNGSESEAQSGNEQPSAGFGVIYPAYQPEGVTEVSTSQTKLGERDAVVIRYSGAYNYALVESAAQAEQTVSSMFGTVIDVDLGQSVGVLIGDEQRTLLWTYEGVDYRLITGDLTYDEMVRVAQSTFGQVGK